MKKLFLSLLSLIYITVASGVVVNIHYCMGKWSGTDYSYHTNEDTCGRCGMENKKGCCHSEFKIVKLADDQQQAKTNAGLSPIPLSVDVQFVDLSKSLQGSNKLTAFIYYPPPGITILPVYLQNCVFRI